MAGAQRCRTQDKYVAEAMFDYVLSMLMVGGTKRATYTEQLAKRGFHVPAADVRMEFAPKPSLAARNDAAAVQWIRNNLFAVGWGDTSTRPLRIKAAALSHGGRQHCKIFALKQLVEWVHFLASVYVEARMTRYAAALSLACR
jgi:hypothetical protein